MEKFNQNKEQTDTLKITSIALSIIGSILLVLLIVSIYVNNNLLPNETNALTKSIIIGLISCSILIILFGVIMGLILIRLCLFDTTLDKNIKNTTTTKHRKFRSLDTITTIDAIYYQKNINGHNKEELEFIV